VLRTNLFILPCGVILLRRYQGILEKYDNASSPDAPRNFHPLCNDSAGLSSGQSVLLNVHALRSVTDPSTADIAIVPIMLAWLKKCDMIFAEAPEISVQHGSRR
jgi:hypothetical protein